VNGAELRALRGGALAAGAAGLALALIAALFDRRQFFRSYLVAFLFWIGLPVGCWALLMLHHLVGGRWGFMIQRPLEAAARTFPVMAVLFLPVVFGLRELYPWAAPGTAETDPFIQEKSSYLNTPFFLARAAFYFAVWFGWGRLLHRWSVDQDRTGDPSYTIRLQNWSGVGLLLYGLTVTFSAIDWAMSLEPHWYSTIYGALFMVGDGLAALSFAIVIAFFLSAREPLSHVAHPDRFHDLGNLLLALVMLWAYLSFSQFLIIWWANLKEEVPWYLSRTEGGWEIVALVLIAFKFALPFLLLLSRAAKRRARVLAGIALWVLVMHWVDLVWIVAPAFHPGDLDAHWLDLAAFAGIGGLWLGAFLHYLGDSALLPLRDPRFADLLHEAGSAR
jgi:hypothetical protein